MILNGCIMQRNTQMGKAKSIKKKVEDFTQTDLKHKCRKREIVEPRFVAVYLIRYKTDLTLIKIAGMFGYLHHEGVIHACKSVDNLLNYDKKFKNKYQRFIDSFN